MTARRSWASSDHARRTMQANRRRDTKPELRLRSEVHRRGLRYRVDVQPVRTIRSRADLVFTPVKVAVFVDGCFWHGCPHHRVAPKTNASYWTAKIEGNMSRDRRVTEGLEREGWTVLRIWEHEDPLEAADRVEATVRRRLEALSAP